MLAVPIVALTTKIVNSSVDKARELQLIGEHLHRRLPHRTVSDYATTRTNLLNVDMVVPCIGDHEEVTV